MRKLKAAIARTAIAFVLLSEMGAPVQASPYGASAPAATSGRVVAAAPARTLTSAKARPLGRRRRSIVPVATPSLAEPFSGTTTASYLWQATGDACLTAGPAPSPSPVPSPVPTTGPPATIPSCGANAPAVDKAGSGALELTQGGTNRQGSVLYKTPFATANGLQVVFTDYAFDGSSPGGDGVSLFLTDASQALPKPVTSPAPSLGYIGMPGAYLGVGFDEGGNFSSKTTGTGGPGAQPETIALRGETALQNPYLGGVNANGAPASLPFNFDQPTLKTRPANAPTLRVTILPTGEVIAEADIHDGNGFLTYFDGQTVGNGGQPALPAQVYLGLAASTSSSTNVHEIGALSVSYLQPGSTAFSPTQIANLAAWYDASDASTLGGTGNAVSTWQDLSGNGNTLIQNNTSSMPATGPNIDGLGALSFAGGQYLTSENQLFSANLFNASTVFVVTNQSNVLQNSSVLSAGSNASTQSRYDLRLSDNGLADFDFNNTGAGRLTVNTPPTGPTLWAASGSLAAGAQYLRKNGLNIASSTGPGTAASGAFPLLIGANLSNNGTNYDYRGKLGEVLVFNSVLSSSDTATVEGYLACKWGLQQLLPANHPYARVCPAGIAPVASVTLPSAPSGALVEPTSLVSQNGFLTLSLVATAGANGNPTLTYNGVPNPPTLRLLPGDVLTINLTNNLPTPPANAGYLNDTNLHFHGLHVSPNAPSDDSIDLIALPGQSLQYKIAIPVTHPPGLYWYHSHAHGEAERQNLAGMSGAIVIDGIAAPNFVPQVANMTEQILIARDTEPSGQPLPDANRKQIQAMFWAMKHANTSRAKGGSALPGMLMASTRARMTMGSAIEVLGRTNAATHNPFVPVEAKYRNMSRKRFDASDGHCVGPETAVRGLTLNGATVPSISIQPGEQQFWRFVNAGSDTYIDLSLDNASLQVVSIDGVPISSGINTPTSLTVPDFVVPPSGRVEFIVTGPPAGTTSYLRTLCFDAGATGSAMPAAILASINPNPPTGTIPRPVQRISPRMRPYRFAHGKRRAAVTVARTQTLTYSDQNNIDGIAYDPAAPPKFYAQSGTYEEWTIVNTSQQVHTFHIHQIHFVVEAIDGVAQSQEYEWDNVNVPPASASGPGSVKLLMDFTDPIDIGTFLLHCHILSHEDQGMMAKIMVGTAPPMSLSSSSVTFASPTAAAQSVTITGGAAPYSVTGCSTVANASISGTTVNLTPAGAGSCVLSVSDSSGQTANLTITVNAPPAALTTNPTSVGFTSTTAAAQTVTIAGGTAPYTAGTCVSGSTTIATASVNGTSLSITPAGAGACTLTITDSTTPTANTANISVSVNTGGTSFPPDNVTFHHDVSRSGWYNDETQLTPANVGGGNFGLLTTLSGPNLTCPGGSACPAFGKVYAQPLYASDETTSVDNATHNLVIIATSTDQLVAIDDQTDKVVWEHSFTGTTNGTTVVQQSYADINCDDINPNIGITGTPVIDRSKDMIYVVVPTKETTSGSTTYHMRLHAVSLSSGADENAVEVSASVQLATGGTASTNAETNNQRGALLEANGNIYVPLASHCDYDQTTVHGWLLSYSVSNLSATGVALNTTNATPNSGDFLGSIWMSGYGPAADAQGNIYFVTGNGPWDGQNDFAMSDIEVPGNLDMANISYFTPIGESADSGSDYDLGSGGIMLLPTLTSGNYPYVAIQQGKCGYGSANGGDDCNLYVLNRSNMGGQQTNNAGALQVVNTTSQTNKGNGIWGGPAMMQDANGNTYVFMGGGNLTDYKVTFSSGGVPQLTANGSISSSVGCLECRDSGSQPVVSSNGTTSGTAVVWALQTPSNGGNISLYAFNPSSNMATLYNAVAGTWTDSSGSYIAGALVSPMVANGKVYVPADGTVEVFGVK